MSLTVFIGGISSGKTRCAQAYAETSSVCGGGGGDARYWYIAAGAPGTDECDAEMSEKIALHRQERGAHWQTLEPRHALAECLDSLEVAVGMRNIVLIDSIGSWIGSLLLDFAHAPTVIDSHISAGIDAVVRASRPELAPPIAQHEIKGGTRLARATLLADRMHRWHSTRQQPLPRTDIIVVIEEVGASLVSPHAMGRQFQRRIGEISQRLVAEADRRYFVRGGKRCLF